MPDPTNVQPEDPRAQAQGLVNELKNQPSAQENGDQGQEDQFNLPEGLDMDTFKAALKEVTGVEDPGKLREFQTSAEKYQQELQEARLNLQKVQQEAQSLKARSELSPYANPFVEQIDKFFREEKDEATIRRFIGLHSHDVDSMDPAAAVRQKMAMENPHLDRGDIDILLEERFGAMPEIYDDMTDEEKARAQREKQKIEAKIKVEGKNAKQWLKEQRQSFEDPATKEKMEKQRQAMDQYTEAWGNVAQELVTVEDSIPYEVEAKEFGKYEHPGYKPNLSKEEQEEIAHLVRDFAVQQQLPLSKESIPELAQYKEALIWNMKREEIMRSILTDFHAEISKFYMEKFAGGQRPQSTGAGRTGTEPPPAPQKRNPNPPPRPGQRQDFF